MNNVKWIVPVAFILMVAGQLIVPARMILTREEVMAEGTAYKFRTAPVDPNDPFRGKYVQLAFADDAYVAPAEEMWIRGDHVYVTLATDAEGFAKIFSISTTEPGIGYDYFSSTVESVYGDSIRTVQLKFPFDRFYMEESKAPAAEAIYREIARDSQQVMYALVMVGEGTAVLQEVYIGSISISDLTHQPVTVPE